jgi:broad specificity phosphatase PhoE
MTYEECVESWRKRRAISSGGGSIPENDEASVVPPLETEDDVWDRARSFLEGILRDAVQRDAEDAGGKFSAPNVLAVAHAGFIRQILKHVVGYETLQTHPASVFVSDADRGSGPASVSRRFIIPNASLSVLELEASLATTDSEALGTSPRTPRLRWDRPWQAPDEDSAASTTSNTASLLLLNYTNQGRGGDN